ncbi:lamin tail domain-containing protein [Candidatus Jorgensenbacteria bacterium]|nr:lamin tail domain-containing protein [Candidatus Jorgensenbacteria bacterium]
MPLEGYSELDQNNSDLAVLREHRKRKKRYFVITGLVIVVLFGSYFFIVYVDRDPPFFSNFVSLMRETFSSRGELVAEIQLNGRDSRTLNNNQVSGKTGDAFEEDRMICSFVLLPSTRVNPSIIINEVAWMGAKEAVDEWIELKNISVGLVDISGWQLIDRDQQISITFPLGARIESGKFYLLERKEEAVSNAVADLLYTGNLKNTDDGLELFDTSCNFVDGVVASPSWPAGNGDTKKTMERDRDGMEWYTSSVIFGTPKKENSSKPLIKIPINTLSSPLISEIMVGVEGNVNYEFIELYNPNTVSIDLSGWSIKKRSSVGSESSFVATDRLRGKMIQPKRRFLLVNAGGYNGNVTPDVKWAISNTLAYTNNSVILYNAAGIKVEEISWNEIPKGQSYERVSWDSNQFVVQSSPTPQNSEKN